MRASPAAFTPASTCSSCPARPRSRSCRDVDGRPRRLPIDERLELPRKALSGLEARRSAINPHIADRLLADHDLSHDAVISEEVSDSDPERGRHGSEPPRSGCVLTHYGQATLEPSPPPRPLRRRLELRLVERLGGDRLQFALQVGEPGSRPRFVRRLDAGEDLDSRAYGFDLGGVSWSRGRRPLAGRQISSSSAQANRVAASAFTAPTRADGRLVRRWDVACAHHGASIWRLISCCTTTRPCWSRPHQRTCGRKDKEASELCRTRRVES